VLTFVFWKIHVGCGPGWYTWYRKNQLGIIHTCREKWYQKTLFLVNVFLGGCEILIHRVFCTWMALRTPHKWKNIGSERAHTQRDFWVDPSRPNREISVCVDFFEGNFFPFMGGTWGGTGAKNYPWVSFTPAEKSGSQKSLMTCHFSRRVWNSTWLFFLSGYPLLDAPRGEKNSVRKNNATASFLCFLNPAGPRNLDLCQLFRTGFFSFYGTHRVGFQRKRLSRKIFDTRRETIEINIFIFVTFLCVCEIPPRDFFSPWVPPGMPIYGKKISQENSTQTEKSALPN
jgi:hypothetical protein